MTKTTAALRALGALFAGFAAALPAQALTIAFSTTGFGPVTYFAGTQQESVLDFLGCDASSFCDGQVEVSPGIPTAEVAFEVSFAHVGMSDGTSSGPDETVTIATRMTIAGQTAELIQDARFSQAGNNGFLFNLGRSTTAAFDLGDDGVLAVTLSLPLAQLIRGGATGNGSIVLAAFELLTPRLIGLGDIDGTGSGEVGVLVDGTSKFVIKDTGDSSEVSQVIFDRLIGPLAFRVAENFGGTPAPEIVGLDALRRVEVRDARSGGLLNTFASLDFRLSPADLAVLADRDNSGAPEIAVLSKSVILQNTVEVRDGLRNHLISALSYPRALTPKRVLPIDDVTGDGLQELAMLGEHVSKTKGDKVQLRDPANGGALGSLWLGTTHEVHRSVALGDITGDGIGEIATLRSKPDAVDVVIHDPATRTWIKAIGFAAHYRPLALLALQDPTGIEPPGLAVLGRHANGTQRVVVKDAVTGQRRMVTWINPAFEALDATLVPDLNGNGPDDIAVLGRRKTDGKLVVFVKDGATGTPLRWIPF